MVLRWEGGLDMVGVMGGRMGWALEGSVNYWLQNGSDFLRVLVEIHFECCRAVQS